MKTVRLRMVEKRQKGVFGQWEANRLDIGPLCANFPAWPYQLIKKVIERRGERGRERERERSGRWGLVLTSSLQ